MAENPSGPNYFLKLGTVLQKEELRVGCSPGELKFGAKQRHICGINREGQSSQGELLW